MKIIYMGSPEFALPALIAIHKSKNELVCCYSQPPRARNRGKKILKTVIHEYCDENNIKCLTPINFKDKSDLEALANMQPDLLVVCAYGLILPQSLLDIPKYGAINIHPSSLPRWRGAAPIQRTIIAGDKSTDICIISMTKELDQGDIILSENLLIPDHMTASELHDISANIGADLTLKVIAQIAQGSATYLPQSKDGVTYAAKITKAETEIDFTLNGHEIINLIRGLADYPAAFTYLDGKRLKIFKASFENSLQNEAIKISKDGLGFKCSDGVIIPESVQYEGKSRMPVAEFLKGFI
jgi:methionyl-tRNA formyltransferase